MKKILTLMCMLGLCFYMVACSNEKTATEKDTDADKIEYLELALEEKENGNYDKAEELFLKDIEVNTDSEHSYLELADIYIRQNKIREAYDILIKGSAMEECFGIEDKLLEFNVANVITDSDELVRGRCYFDETDTLKWYHIYNYAEDGTRTGVTLYNGENKEIDSIDFEYNSNKKPVCYYSYCKDGSIGKLLFEYNDDGNITKITEYENGGESLLGYTYIEYNENGYKAKETNVFADNSPHWEYNYSYDDEQSGTFEIAFFGKKIGGGEFVVDEDGKVDIRTRRTQGYFDIDISHEVDYEANEERVEVGDEEGQKVRVVCYGS